MDANVSILMRSKLENHFRKPFEEMEEKFQNDLNQIEYIKNLFYEIDKTSIKINYFKSTNTLIII